MNPFAHRGRTWVIGGILALGTLLLAGGLYVRRETGVASMERRLLAALGPEGDSLYRVRVGSSHLSVLGGTYLATGIEIIPDSAAFRRRREAGHPVRSRFLLRAASFTVTGLDVWGLVRGRLEAAGAVAESLLVEADLDRTVPGTGDTVRRLPHEFFRTIAKPVRLDTFRLENSEFRYSERAIDGARAGTIRFAETNIGVYHLTNDTLRSNPPVVIDLRTLLAGTAPTTATFSYDFRAPGLNLEYHGAVRDLEARRLNDMTVNLVGIRLTGGRLDSARFTFRVRDGVADGDMQMLYRGLRAEFVDKVTRESGLSDWLKTMVARTFVLRGHNRGDEDHHLRTASIRGFRRTPDLTLIKYVWHTLREGLLVTIQGESPTGSPGTTVSRARSHRP